MQNAAHAPLHGDEALFTDLYQLTMLQAYWREGMDQEAVFDCFVRRLKHRNYLLACGLESVLSYLENLRFSETALDYLARQEQFEPNFLDYLADFRFTGDVYAIPEGTPVFADEPILEVVAPIGQAQLIETFILNQITYQTNLATKAHRVVRAARGRTVADFGMRRMHGTDAAMKAARAASIAGVDATSNVLAGMRHGLPITGTMAHSYVEAHDEEGAAFEAFSELYPETTLLVDTYDTLEGVREVIAMARRKGEDFRVRALRLDSGDLAELARSARRLLDDAGLNHVKLFASGSLDEFAITELLDQSAPIDGFGVGTRLGTISDMPYLDSAYKLSQYAGTPRMKLSTAKSNLPGQKQVVRQEKAGQAAQDVIVLREEDPPAGRPLLKKVMRRGERTEEGQTPAIEELQERVERETRRLPERLLAFDKVAPPYQVTLSSRLETLMEGLQEKLERTV